ncbi:T6SS immunity protein Tli4 family protein [Massilia sp. YIM B02443]|uniref:T6SS immunity protein Tli4 family protein n=1 Tax=Massilia sp. YIM B02443 TaxID=3050127 RepID=UPI0025B6FDEB|nr:T6SS immunity protein Tli4 family protein [Massilia sp. YIM B02443]MDN4036631.1 T6SS immunity protein Tli4 family protein [Massilia sp. YIM B02443]
MYPTAIQRLLLAPIAAAALLLAACDHQPKEWKKPNMTTLTPRLQPLFEKTKTVCFGRFMVDVPVSAAVAWGETTVSLGVSIYPDGVDKVKAEAQQFIDELKSEKAIYLNNIPLLISVEDIRHPEGKIVTGYEGFEAIGELKINGYFSLNNDGVVIDARPLKQYRERATATIKSIARRLRQRADDEAPAEPGNCLKRAFLPDSPDDEEGHPGEFVNIGFRLMEFPDVHFSIQVRPTNPHDPERESLKAQWQRMKDDKGPPEVEEAFAKVKYFRESPRQLHEWTTGYEVLTWAPDEGRVHAYHDFELRFTGVAGDALKPYASIQLQTGVGNNAAGAVKASLTDAETIALWDKMTSTVRVRPTSAASIKSAGSSLHPHVPIGELAATGRICPQTGWWESDQPGEKQDNRRRHIQTGERMPHVVSLDEPSLWQKFKGERPSYRKAAIWKLVSYGEATAGAGVAAQAASVAQVSLDDVSSKDARAGTPETGTSEGTSPQKKG